MRDGLEQCRSDRHNKRIRPAGDTWFGMLGYDAVFSWIPAVILRARCKTKKNKSKELGKHCHGKTGTQSIMVLLNGERARI